MNTKTTLTITAAALLAAFAGQAPAEGNRYNYERYYKAEISVSDAYLAMEHSKGYDNKSGKDLPKPVLVDVRTLNEYAAGHPEDAYNVPYPRIDNGDPNVTPSIPPQPQTAAMFYDEVYRIVKGRMDTPIMLLCRTGSRSVRAGNILANPDSNDGTKGLAPFTNVYNIWEGFVGQYRYAMDSKGIPVIPLAALDLNDNSDLDVIDPKDGLDDDTADVYVEVKDYNPDKDGWRNFAALPWTTQILKPLSYLRDPAQYAVLPLTPVE